MLITFLPSELSSEEIVNKIEKIPHAALVLGKDFKVVAKNSKVGMMFKDVRIGRYLRKILPEDGEYILGNMSKNQTVTLMLRQSAGQCNATAVCGGDFYLLLADPFASQLPASVINLYEKASGYDIQLNSYVAEYTTQREFILSEALKLLKHHQVPQVLPFFNYDKALETITEVLAETGKGVFTADVFKSSRSHGIAHGSEKDFAAIIVHFYAYCGYVSADNRVMISISEGQGYITAQVSAVLPEPRDDLPQKPQRIEVLGEPESEPDWIRYVKLVADANLWDTSIRYECGGVVLRLDVPAIAKPDNYLLKDIPVDYVRSIALSMLGFASEKTLE